MDEGEHLNLKNGQDQLTWGELKSSVNDIRRKLWSFSTMIPKSIQFRKLPDGRVRMYFISTPASCRESTLLFTDISDNEQSCNSKLTWHTVIESNFPTVLIPSKYSREEQLLWERKRLATWGVTSFELHNESGKLIFPTAGSIYQIVDSGYTIGPFFPSEVRTSPVSSGSKLCPSLCPVNSDLIAYLYNYDIWVVHTLSGNTVRLTYSHKGGRSINDDPLTSGLPSYVIQEEFNRYQGYWWQPKCFDGVYRIVYEEIDESDVKLFRLLSTPDSDIEEFRFPRTGTPNAKSILKMVEFKIDESYKICDIKNLELQYSLSTFFSWAEYLIRVGWMKDAKNIWVQLLDRRQQHLEIALISIDCFVESNTFSDNSFSIDNILDYTSSSQSGNSVELNNKIIENNGLIVNEENKMFSNKSAIIQVIYSERCKPDLWINVADILYFLPNTNQNEIKFIISNEETGFRHLYLITIPHINDVNTASDEVSIMETSPNRSSEKTNECAVYLEPKILQKIPLTSGEWEVDGEEVWVDEKNQLVYFLGLRESPLEKHLYVVSLKRPEEIRQLTNSGYSYLVNFNQDCSILITEFSNLKQLPACEIYRITHADWTVDGVQLVPLGYLMHPQLLEEDAFSPEIHTYKLSQTDQEVYAMVFKPHNFVPNKKYPTILSIYGGPEVQLVTNVFKGMRQLRLHMLASRGYCVIAIDTRGSKHRGIVFEAYLRGRLGQVELDDQVEVLKWLASTKCDFIDLNRIAIHGWSYGGYLSLMGLVHYPDIFKIAIAGAPVTNWLYYDTGYTERYMDLPYNNAEGYQNGCVLNYINKFPDQENRLFIIHGMIDENVHFFHTTELVNALIKAGKPYQLQVYPNERHSLRHLEASIHYETLLLSYIQKNL